MTLYRPCCRIETHTVYHLVPVELYEGIRDELDKGEKGWREYPLVEDPSGRCLMRLEDLRAVSLYPQAWCDAKHQIDADARQRERLEDG